MPMAMDDLALDCKSWNERNLPESCEHQGRAGQGRAGQGRAGQGRAGVEYRGENNNNDRKNIPNAEEWLRVEG